MDDQIQAQKIAEAIVLGTQDVGDGPTLQKVDTVVETSSTTALDGGVVEASDAPPRPPEVSG